MRQPSSPRTKILVVEDHPIVRLGIRQIIAEDPQLTLCGEAESADEALERAQSARPDLILVDLSLESGTGLSLIKSLREALPAVRILVVSMHDEALFAERALRAGAHGYLMKRNAIDHLRDAIREVLAGRMYFSEQTAQQVFARLGRNADRRSGPLAHLTDRELEVLEFIGKGLSTAEIAGELDVSVKTIETYRANLKWKLNLKDANDLVRFAALWAEQL